MPVSEKTTNGGEDLQKVLKLKVDLSCGPAMLLLSIYPQDSKSTYQILAHQCLLQHCSQ